MTELAYLFDDIRAEAESLQRKADCGVWGQAEAARARALITGPMSRLCWELRPGGELDPKWLELVNTLQEEFSDLESSVSSMAETIEDLADWLHRVTKKLAAGEARP